MLAWEMQESVRFGRPSIVTKTWFSDGCDLTMQSKIIVGALEDATVSVYRLVEDADAILLADGFESVESAKKYCESLIA